MSRPPDGSVLAPPPAVVCPQPSREADSWGRDGERDARARSPLQGDAEITPVTACEAQILSTSVPREKAQGVPREWREINGTFLEICCVPARCEGCVLSHHVNVKSPCQESLEKFQSLSDECFGFFTDVYTN